jgi:hypothetical protein
VHTLVDDGSAERERAGSVPHHLALSALLQRPHRLLQEPGLSPRAMRPAWKLTQ